MTQPSKAELQRAALHLACAQFRAVVRDGVDDEAAWHDVEAALKVIMPDQFVDDIQDVECEEQDGICITLGDELPLIIFIPL